MQSRTSVVRAYLHYAIYLCANPTDFYRILTICSHILFPIGVLYIHNDIHDVFAHFKDQSVVNGIENIFLPRVFVVDEKYC